MGIFSKDKDMMKPAYIINGFLESGKTEFITYTLGQPYFRIKGKTLLILCEEGEIEYEEALLKQSKTIVEVIEDESDFTPEKLSELENLYKPERIVIEYNGMWNCKDMVLPDNWEVAQQITTINAETFPMFYNNMKSLVAEMVRKSELIIFNRCDNVEDLGNYKRNIKAVNPQAEIIFEGSEGEINEILEEDLPFDINADVIKLDDEGFSVWYLDSYDHLERYVGKTLEFLAQVYTPKGFPKGYFVPGRMVMTCCADDMAFLGFPCKCSGADLLVQKSWVTVKVKVNKAMFPGYQGEGPVLEAISVVKAKAPAPKDQVINFGA